MEEEREEGAVEEEEREEGKVEEEEKEEAVVVEPEDGEVDLEFKVVIEEEEELKTEAGVAMMEGKVTTNNQTLLKLKHMTKMLSSRLGCH